MLLVIAFQRLVLLAKITLRIVSGLRAFFNLNWSYYFARAKTYGEKRRMVFEVKRRSELLLLYFLSRARKQWFNKSFWKWFFSFMRRSWLYDLFGHGFCVLVFRFIFGPVQGLLFLSFLSNRFWNLIIVLFRSCTPHLCTFFTEIQLRTEITIFCLERVSDCFKYQ